MEGNHHWLSVFLVDVPEVEDVEGEIDQLSDWIIDKKTNGLIFVN